MPNTNIIEALLEGGTKATHTMFGEEYKRNKPYFDFIVKHVRKIQTTNKNFQIFRARKLFPWQLTVLRRVMTQDQRQVSNLALNDNLPIDIFEGV